MRVIPRSSKNVLEWEQQGGLKARLTAPPVDGAANAALIDLLAERLAVAKPTITAVVDGLVDRRLVAREAVVGDRRSIRVALTPAGVVALRAAEQEMGETLGRIFEHARDRDVLLGALLDLDDALARRMEARLRGDRGHEVAT